MILYICLIKSPHYTDKYSKKKFDSDFPSPCFDHDISTAYCYTVVFLRQRSRLITQHHLYHKAKDGSDCCSSILPLFRRVAVPSVVRGCTVFLLCFFIVGTHDSGISIPPSLVMFIYMCTTINKNNLFLCDCCL